MFSLLLWRYLRLFFLLVLLLVDGFELIVEHLYTALVDYEDVVRLLRALCTWIELSEQLFGLRDHLALMS